MLSVCVVWTVVLTVVAMWIGSAGAIGNEPDWGFQSYLSENYTLVCNHSSLVVQPYYYVRWELPSNVMLTQNTAKYTMSNNAFVTNMHLTIHDVQESDKGVYVCHVYRTASSAKVGYLLRGLNLGGHMYRDAFDEYRNNLLVGSLAAVVLFVPLVTACLVYKFRFQTAEQKRAKHEARAEATKHQRYLEANGKGSELTDISVNGEGGEINRAYDKGYDETGTRL